ncbi:MAG: hypothetical protein HG422_08370 [Prevotella sp.]|nr:hypothetical protein [Prevotella sp.]
MKENKIIAYKGFDKDLKCHDMQYEVGKTYKTDGDIKCCDSGFHAYENPLDVFGYYAPADSRYCKVEQSGTLSKGADDSKVISSKLRVQCEIGLKGIIEAGVKFIFDKVNWKDNKESNTGYQSAATNTGNCSAATNTGDRSAATNTGDRSAAKVEGKDSIAIVTGKDSKASGALGCWLVLTERDENYHIKEVRAVKVDGKRIKAGTYYKLVDGEVKEVD